MPVSKSAATPAQLALSLLLSGEPPANVSQWLWLQTILEWRRTRPDGEDVLT